MVRSISCGLRPSPTDSEPCGSKSTSSTLRPYSASAAPRLMVVVVLPTPPFWLHIEITRAPPCRVSGVGSGMNGIGLPVGPITTSPASSTTVAAAAVDAGECLLATRCLGEGDRLTHTELSGRGARDDAEGRHLGGVRTGL